MRTGSALPKEKLWVTVYETDDEAFDIWANEVGVRASVLSASATTKARRLLLTTSGRWATPVRAARAPKSSLTTAITSGAALREARKKMATVTLRFGTSSSCSSTVRLTVPWSRCRSRPVDTGMGLERIAAVLQHVNSNYDIDLFRDLIASVAKVTGATDLTNKSLRVIADHIRSCAFLVADGVIPSNENRGYVLRRIIRRAIRHGNMLGAKDTFFWKLVAPLIDVMGSAGDELKQQQAQVEQVLKTEEEQFACTLERGLALLDEELSKLKGDTLDGETAFRLYDTYGFPVDLTADVCAASATSRLMKLVLKPRWKSSAAARAVQWFRRRL